MSKVENLLIECSKLNNFCDYILNVFEKFNSLFPSNDNSYLVIKENCLLLKNTIIFINESYSKNLIDDIQCNHLLDDLKEKLLTLQSSLNDFILVLENKIISDLSCGFIVAQTDVKNILFSLIKRLL